MKPNWRPTRRTFMAASCGLLLPRVGWSAAIPKPILAWPLVRPRRAGQTPEAAASETIVAGTGRLKWVENDAHTELPRLDGYSVWFEQEMQAPVTLGREFSLSAWLALESFPVNTASVIEWGDASSGASLSVDRLGFPLIQMGAGDQRIQARARKPLDCGRWIHIAATLSSRGIVTLYVDAEEHAQAEFKAPTPAFGPIAHVYLGRASECPIVAKVFPTGVLNGLLREIRVYKQCLTSGDIHELAREFDATSASLSINGAWFEGDMQRPQYHAMPPRAWTNEPHGLVHWRGEYHLFYQKNPNGPYWGHIHWGHMTSPDLLHWTEQPMALTPGPGPDSEGCWSGSAIVADGKIHLVYTGGDGKKASICLASSEDGFRFIKHPGNPIIEAPPPNLGVKEFRDPFIWKHGAEYRMIIGSGVENVGGTALLYRSPDLITWHFIKPLLIGDKQTSGVFWEMPVFLKIGEHHVLIVCEVPGRASYWVGTWENDDFRVLSASPRRVDLLNHFLSPTPYTDERDRVITIGIVPDSRDSREAWQAGWAHLYGLPRELTLDEETNLRQRPFAGVETLFMQMLPAGRPLTLREDWQDFEIGGTCLKIAASLERGQSRVVEIALRRAPSDQELTLLRYDWDAQQLTCDRTRSSLNVHVVRSLEHASYAPLYPGRIAFEIFLDRSVLEVFVDDRACFSTRIYPVLPESVGVAIRSQGGAASLLTLRVDTFAAESVIQPLLRSED